MLATASAHASTVLIAAENAQGGGGMLPMLLMLAAMGGLFYFMLIRPQKKQKEKMAQLQAQMQPGTEVLISGGIYATVRELEEDKAQVEVASGVVITIARQAIIRTVDPVVPDSPAGLTDSDAAVDDADSSAKDDAKDAPTAEWPDEGKKN